MRIFPCLLCIPVYDMRILPCLLCITFYDMRILPCLLCIPVYDMRILPCLFSIDVFLHIGKNYRRVGEITRAIIIRLRIDTATRIREVFYNLNNVYNYRIPRHQVCV